MAEASDGDKLKTTPLHDRHVAAGARMVAFAGYRMPVQYATGIIAEHNHTRAAAGLFDVSHMGQGFLVGPDHQTTARALEALLPADILGLDHGRQRYSQLLNEQGGIIDDLMIARSADPADDGRLMLVVNAGGKDADWRHLEMNLPSSVKVVRADDRALLALQGPRAEAVLRRYGAAVADMVFMTARSTAVAGINVHISRSGYTGEDGFEVSVLADRAGDLWDRLTADPEVEPIGLGARDSLRLEAGLCLYGHDINTETSPVEAALAWSIGRRRRREGGFPGEVRIRQEIEAGTLRLRVGLRPEGRVPAREGAAILDAAGELVGEVTSGGFGSTAGGPIAMGYVVREFSALGTPLRLVVRDKPIPATVVKMPFVPHRYER